MEQPETRHGLTNQQAEACRLRVLEGEQWINIGPRVGVSRTSVWRWRQLEAWAAYAAELHAEMHEDVVSAHKSAARAGSDARRRAIKRIMDEMEAATDPKDVATLANALDRLTTSAEDRSGYPRTDRVEHSGAGGAPIALDVSSLLQMTPEQLRAAASVEEADDKGGDE